MNRESAIEFTFQGLSHWSQQYSITSPIRPKTRYSPVSTTLAALDRAIPNMRP